MFLQSILAGRQQQTPTPRKFLIQKHYFPDEKGIRGCFYRNEILGFSVAVALSSSVGTHSLSPLFTVDHKALPLGKRDFEIP